MSVEDHNVIASTVPARAGGRRILAVIGLVWLCTACGNSTTTTTPTSTTTTTTVVTPAVTETWTGTVPVAGSAFYSFSTAASGTVQVTLQSVSGQFVPPTVTLGVGVGTPSGASCSTTSTTNAQAGTTAQVSVTLDAGLYCAAVSDVGNLFAPATVSVAIGHP